jgi:hypothetical protein
VAELRRQLKAATGEPVALPAAKSQNLVIYRKNGGLFHAALSTTAFSLLGELAGGRALVEAVDLVMQRGDDPQGELQAQLQHWFHQWAELGWVVRVET